MKRDLLKGLIAIICDIILLYLLLVHVINTNHLRFKEIPMNIKYESFARKLEKKGFTRTENDIFVGDFLQDNDSFFLDNASIDISSTTISDIVYEVTAMWDRTGSNFSLTKYFFDSVVSFYSEKFGKPEYAVHTADTYYYSEFNLIWNEADIHTYNIDDLEGQSYDIVSARFHLKTGVIVIATNSYSMEHNPFADDMYDDYLLFVTYRDNRNYNKELKERSKSITKRQKEKHRILLKQL